MGLLDRALGHEGFRKWLFVLAFALNAANGVVNAYYGNWWLAGLMFAFCWFLVWANHPSRRYRP